MLTLHGSALKITIQTTRKSNRSRKFKTTLNNFLLNTYFYFSNRSYSLSRSVRVCYVFLNASVMSEGLHRLYLISACGSKTSFYECSRVLSFVAVCRTLEYSCYAYKQNIFNGYSIDLSMPRSNLKSLPLSDAIFYDWSFFPQVYESLLFEIYIIL